jgi:Flp pilus assembly protein TadD
VQENPYSAAFLCLLLALSCQKAAMGRSINGWVGSSTPNFVVLTTDPRGRGHEIIERLEVARRFFEKTSWAQRDGNQRVEIVAFGSDKEYDSYRLNSSAYAFYQRTRQNDFIVMRDLDPEHYSVAVHEYTHFIMEHAGLNLPLWLNEGLADFYSTIECRQAQALVGMVPTGRDRILKSQRWMDWATLTSADQNSPYYRQPEKMLLFYSQSWALVHMLAMDAAYAGRFPDFLAAVSSGAGTESALSAVYHKTLQQIGDEVQGYVGSKRLTAHLVNVDARPGLVETQAVADAGKCAEFALAEVLAANPQTADEAKVRLEELTTKYPGDPRGEESLGYIAMRNGSQKDAQMHFAHAVSTNSQDPEVLFRLAHLKLSANGPSDEVIDLLERVIAVDSTHYNALLELGFAAAKCGRYDLAVHTLEKITQPKAEHAYVVSYTLAYSLIELHQGNQARHYAQQATNIASRSKDHEDAAGLMRYIEQESPTEVASR